MYENQSSYPVLTYLGLGSNTGNREQYLNEAISEIENQPETKIRKISSFYDTKPMYLEEQPRFLNACIEIETALEPQHLLDVLQEIELQLGRVRTIANGPRTIDIDILMYGQKRLETSRLILPHPRIFERAFVLVPLAEIAPLLEIEGKTVLEELASLAFSEEALEIFPIAKE